MTEKICYTCKHFELEGDPYFQIEHCMLHEIYQKHRNEPLQVCDDWTQSKYAGVDYVSDLVDELNEKEETIQDLKTRNNRQYDLLKKITDYMDARNWEALEQMVVEWEEADRLLKAEYKCCNWGDV